MQNRPLTETFHRYLQNKCSPEEVREIIAYFSTGNEGELKALIRQELEKPDDLVAEERLQQLSMEVWEQLKPRLQERPEAAAEPVVVPFRQRGIRRWLPVAAAACLILCTGAGLYLFLHSGSGMPKAKAPLVAGPVQDTLAPAGSKAVLTLSTGRQINLDNAQSGRLATDANAAIRKSSDGKVEYQLQETASRSAAAVAYNTLMTPRGGKYDLTLSDGTKVSLNAASSIRYPSVFPAGSREVEITGEVYFEVAHDSKNPFRVSVAGQLIEDLGTRFNVNAYSDEPYLAATLLEGSVRVSNKNHTALLKPGQQAVVRSDQSLQVKREVDLEEVTAWHRGLFTFRDADIPTVMRQLSRWYDVDISYEGAVPQRRFSGKIYRDISALKVADILQYKQIHFRIEGRKIIVMP